MNFHLSTIADQSAYIFEISCFARSSTSYGGQSRKAKAVK